MASEISQEAMRLHDAAVQRGQGAYVDPETGHFVFTARRLLDQGACCGSGCRHCPWPPDEQRRAGRPGT